MNEQDFAALNAKAIAQSDAEDPAVIEAVLDIVLTRRRRTAKVHEALIQDRQFADVSLEAVQQIVGSIPFLRRLQEAQEDPEKYVKEDVKRTLTKHWRGVKRLASEGNDDKRTRTSNLHFALGVGGFSPAQKVEAGEDLLAVFNRIVGPSLKPKDAERQEEAA